jgi:hypothetical protein
MVVWDEWPALRKFLCISSPIYPGTMGYRFSGPAATVMLALAIGRADSVGANEADDGALSRHTDSEEAMIAAVAGAMGGTLGTGTNPESNGLVVARPATWLGWVAIPWR